MTDHATQNSTKPSFFRNSAGKIVTIQRPNGPLMVWIILEAISVAVHRQPLKKDIGLVSMASLAVFAYLEITDGVNYFRRLLGLAVMIAVVVGFFSVK
jgi:hypothetical protein